MKDQSINKTVVIGLIEKLKSNLETILEENAPIGGSHIEVKHYHGNTYFHLVDSHRKTTYLKLSQKKEISKHAQRRFINEVIKATQKEIHQLDRCLKILTGSKAGISDINDVLTGFPEQLKPYINPTSLSDDEYARKWQEENTVVKKKNIHREDDYHRFKTLRGDYVGSKSEVIIADRLFANQIPYHYEVAFIPEVKSDKSLPIYDNYGRIIGYEAPGFDPFSRDTLHPDFYVLNKRTRKAYFWEHLGKMNDPKYCMDNFNRFVRILDAGYTIGEEILITHEDTQNPLRLERVDEIIEKYLK